jgi:hypothetical protein
LVWLEPAGAFGFSLAVLVLTKRMREFTASRL